MTENLITYKYQNSQVEILPKFLYRVELFKETPNIKGLLDTKYYVSSKPLNICENKILKHFKNFNIVQYITLLGVPQSFRIDNNLKIYNKNEKRTN